MSMCIYMCVCIVACVDAGIYSPPRKLYSRECGRVPRLNYAMVLLFKTRHGCVPYTAAENIRILDAICSIIKYL